MSKKAYLFNSREIMTVSPDGERVRVTQGSGMSKREIHVNFDDVEDFIEALMNVKGDIHQSMYDEAAKEIG